MHLAVGYRGAEVRQGAGMMATVRAAGMMPAARPAQ
jgi:hypothetical protein